MPEEDRFELHEGAFAANSPSYVLKFERATELLIGLRDETDSFLETLLTSPLRVERRAEGWLSVKWGEVPPLPMNWRLHFGDAMHNLRTALDHMVYDLGVTHGLARRDHLQFPTATNAADWTNQIEPPRPGKPGRLTGLPEEVVQAIRATQPFVNVEGRQPDQDPLFLLLRLDNVDKHRIVHEAVIAQSEVTRVAFDPPGSMKVTKMRKMPGWRMCVTNGEIARLKVRDVKRGAKLKTVSWDAPPRIFCRTTRPPDDAAGAEVQFIRGTDIDTLAMLTRVDGVGRALASIRHQGARLVVFA